MNNVENITLSVMTISDLENIKDILISDFDDYWNYNTLKEELTCENSIYIVAKQESTHMMDKQGVPSLSFKTETINKNHSNYSENSSLQNTIVGFAGIKIILDEAELMNIVVNKASRHSGIGTLLLNKLLEICKEKNLDSIFLEVNEKNLNAQKLYKNFGFETISIRKNYYNSDNGIVMKKDFKTS